MFPLRKRIGLVFSAFVGVLAIMTNATRNEIGPKICTWFSDCPEWLAGSHIPPITPYLLWLLFFATLVFVCWPIRKSEPIGSIDALPDGKLIELTLKLAAQIRKFDVNFHHSIRSSSFNSWAGSVPSGEMSEDEGRRRFLANTHRLNQLSEQYSEQLLQRYRPDAVLFRNQIKKRLGMLQENPPIEIVAFFDHAQVVNSAAVRAADYLDDLARRLDKSY